MQGTLVLTVLSIQSSYVREIETPLARGGVPDTIQWWIAPAGVWRIRTFALDHDIHTHSIPPSDDPVALALSNAQQHYGDVIQRTHVIELADCLDEKAVVAAFQNLNLEPRLEIASGRFAFWKPDAARYHTQSQPRTQT